MTRIKVPDDCRQVGARDQSRSRFHSSVDTSIDATPIRQACWTEVALDIACRSAEHERTARRIQALSMVFVDAAVGVRPIAASSSGSGQT